MKVLEFQWRKYLNIGTTQNPMWSKGVTITYKVPLNNLEIEKLPDGFIEGLLIREADLASNPSKYRFAYIGHQVNVLNSDENEFIVSRTIRKLIASKISENNE